MLRSIYEQIGYRLEAGEEEFGRVSDLLFDEDQWTVRWLVADTGTWLPGKKVLISPVALGEPDWEHRLFPVRMTREEIEKSPDLDKDAPVSREYEKHWFDAYGWPYYWAPGPADFGGGGAWGGAMLPQALMVQRKAHGVKDKPLPEAREKVVRSVMEVRGYHFLARDGDCGHVDDFIVDDESWTLRYLVIDTRNWLPGRKVLLATDGVESIVWADKQVASPWTREKIKDSPAYDPSMPVNREYEQRLYDYYGRPVYWAR